MNNLFGELKQFDAGKLKDVPTVVKQYKPFVTKETIINKQSTQIETYDGEEIRIPQRQQQQQQSEPPVTLSAMEEFLITVGLKASNIDDYCLLLEDSGYVSSDDLLIADLSVEQLAEIGIFDEGDRKKLWEWLHPEQVLKSAESASSSDELTRILLGTTDDDLSEIIKLKAEIDALNQLK